MTTEAALRRQVEDLAADIPRGSTEPGEGSVKGWVQDGDGRPVPGALVRLTPLNYPEFAKTDSGVSWQRPDEPPEDRLGEKVREVMRKQLLEQTLRREGRTDSAGAFEVGGLDERLYSIKGWCRGWRISRAPGQPVLVRAGDTAQLLAVRVVDVPITVEMPEGSPAASAMIHLGSEGRSNLAPHREWTGQPMHIPLPAGSHVLQAFASEPRAMSSPALTVEVDAAQPPEPVRLILEPRRIVSGKLSFVGEPPHRVFVTLHRLTDGRSPREAAEGPFTKPPLEYDPQILPHPDRGWRFAFEDLHPGPWVVAVRSLDPLRLMHFEAIEVGDGPRTVDMVIPIQDAVSILRVRVLDPAGEPANGANVICHLSIDSSSGASIPRTARPTRDDSGEPVYTVSVPSDGLSLGGFLHVTLPQLGQRTQPIAPGAAGEVTVQFSEAARLEVTVPGIATHPARERLSVSLTLLSTTGEIATPEGERALSECGPEETLTFGALQPGRVRLSLRATGPESLALDLTDEIVPLTAGTNRHVLSLPHLQDVIITFPEGSDGRRVVVVRDDHRDPQQLNLQDYITPSLKVTFRDLPPGDYTVSDGFEIGCAAMSFSIPGPSRLEFAGKPLNVFRIVITDPAGLLARGGFRDGDLVTTVNGVPVAENVTALNLSFEGHRTTFGVIRRGREQTITVDLSAALQTLPDAPWGGSLQPTSR